MKSILNLIIFLGLIYIIVIFCNNMKTPDEVDEKFDPDDESEWDKFKEKKVIRGYPTMVFDYGNVDPYPKEDPIEERYQKELVSGAGIVPEYTNNKFTDQKAIYNYDFYRTPVHESRSFEQPTNSLPKKISDIFEESITDVRKFTPKKEGEYGNFIVEGGSNQSAFIPDFISYKDEKPENGGMYPNSSVFGYDPMLISETATF